MIHIIVGIDTGKTSAIACLDLEGRPVHLATRRFADLRWFIENIIKAGSPVVIAGDRKKNNDFLSKIASIFDASLFAPKEDISVVRKRELTDEWTISNDHERDALSAALVAYNNYSSKLKHAERLAKIGGVDEVDRIKAMVIKKHSIDEAINNKRSGRFVR